MVAYNNILLIDAVFASQTVVTYMQALPEVSDVAILNNWRGIFD